MKAYLEKITPNVSDAWRADELYVKVRGNPKYLFTLLDDETRFWIAQQVADTKYTSNIRPLLENAKAIAGKRPNTFITDGTPNFADAFKKEFFTINNPRTSIRSREIMEFVRGNMLARRRVSFGSQYNDSRRYCYTRKTIMQK